MNWLKSLFKTPTAQELARRELDEAERELLVAHTRKEMCAVEAQLCEANIDVLYRRVQRLKAYVNKP